MVSLLDDFVATADHLAGSVDESIGRQFDEEEGGGFADDTVEQTTGLFDHLAGSVDESIGRQFDDKPGGGFFDETGQFIAGSLDFLAGDLDEKVGQNTQLVGMIVVVVILVAVYAFSSSLGDVA